MVRLPRTTAHTKELNMAAKKPAPKAAEPARAKSARPSSDFDRMVKIPKSVKTMAGTILCPHQRGAFIRSYVNVLLEQKQTAKRK